MILHGDSRETDWYKALDYRAVNCIVTDPPYGINYTSFRSQTHESDQLFQPIASDGDVDGAIQTFLDVMGPLSNHTAVNCELYVFTRYDILRQWEDVVDLLPMFKRKMVLVWDKSALALGDIDGGWNPSYELIIYAKKGRRDVNHQRPSVLRFDRPKVKSRVHPTEKPPALIKELLRVSTDPGDLVVDPFAGSGSSLVAAKDLGREYVGVELVEDYYLKAKKRLEQALLFQEIQTEST